MHWSNLFLVFLTTSFSGKACNCDKGNYPQILSNRAEMSTRDGLDYSLAILSISIWVYRIFRVQNDDLWNNLSYVFIGKKRCRIFEEVETLPLR